MLHTGLAEMVCPSPRVMSPDAVAEVMVSLLGAKGSVETGSALRVGPDAVEPIGA